MALGVGTSTSSKPSDLVRGPISTRATVEIVGDDGTRQPPAEGWEDFFAANADALVHTAASILKGRTSRGNDAEDVAFQALANCIAKGIPKGVNARAYVLAAVRRGALDALRRRKFHTDEEIDLDERVGTPDIEEDVDDALLLEEVLEALDDVPEREATALRGLFLEEMPWEVVAEKVGLTSQRGTTDLADRAIARLRKMPRFRDLTATRTAPPGPSTTTGSPTAP